MRIRPRPIFAVTPGRAVVHHTGAKTRTRRAVLYYAGEGPSGWVLAWYRSGNLTSLVRYDIDALGVACA